MRPLRGPVRNNLLDERFRCQLRPDNRSFVDEQVGVGSLLMTLALSRVSPEITLGDRRIRSGTPGLA